MHETTHLSHDEGTVNITLNSESLYEIAAPAYRLVDYDAFLEACFTKKELELISGGQVADASINLTISEDIGDEVLKDQLSAARHKEEANQGVLSEAMYVELSAQKSVGDSSPEAISSLSEDMFLEMDIPLYLIQENRSYWVLMSNMGEAVLLPDIDSEPNTITISTHNIGTGIILYQDPLDSLSEASKEGFHLKGIHLLYAGIVLLLGVWLIITHLHKNDV